ncbi:ABC-three component system protein [Modestobacter lacusdianchii]
MLPTAAWLDWYANQNERACRQSGQAFEDHVTRVLSFFHDDFDNPVPTGSLGDGGSDGLAEAGTICYACYGSVAQTKVEEKLTAKIKSDFARALSSYPSFNAWRFITNVPVGPIATKALIELKSKHENDSTRPIAVRHWTVEKFWFDVVSKLAPDRLAQVFPGLPGTANVQLADLIPLLEALGSTAVAPGTVGSIRPVPVEKMDYNGLSVAKQLEFNAGRLSAASIDTWFAEVSDPELYDRQAGRFREIYLTHRAVSKQPEDILERIYASLGGTNFRFDNSRANAVYAVTSYFFDACHIFEEPPASYKVGDPGAFAD